MKSARRIQGKRKLAIFDIDGTIFRSALFIELLHVLVKQGIFPKTVLKEIEKDYLAWVHRRGSYETYSHQIVGIFKREIKGCKEADIKKAARKVIDEQKEKVYRFTRDLIEDFKDKKYFILAVSGSPEAIVSEFTKHYGFDAYFGTIQEVENGILTGRESGVLWDKEKIIKNFLTDNPQFNNDKSVGVGDTEMDIPFLEMVANPIAFNPNAGLAAHAKKMGWRIVVERKDVIYDIGEFKMLGRS